MFLKKEKILNAKYIFKCYLISLKPLKNLNTNTGSVRPKVDFQWLEQLKNLKTSSSPIWLLATN